MTTIERLTDIETELGESPFWSVAEQALWWIDWETMEVLRLDWATGAVTRWPAGVRTGCLVGRADGGAMLATAAGFQAFDPATGSLTPVADPDPDPDTEFNDGKCDRRGRFWAGTMDPAGERPLGRLWRLDGDGASGPHGPPVCMVNGPCWSPDDRVFYVADTGSRTLYAGPFDLEKGWVGTLAPFATVEAPGVPDGATVDAEGFIWWTEFDNGRVRRYAPDGRVDRTITLPVSQPTSCAFGGPGLDRLIVTTARYRFDAARARAEPLAGALLSIDVGVRGLPEPVFAGA